MPHLRTPLVGAILLGATLLAWPAVGLTQSSCGSGALPACGAPEPAPVAAPTSGEIVADEWRLLSSVFAALPAGGYPIAFRPDGAAQTGNLAGVTGWSMPAAGRLELTGGGRVLYGFLWSKHHGAFRHVIAGGTAAGLSMVIVPVGLDPLRAAAAMDERRRGEVDPALLRSLLAAPPPAPVVLRGAKVSEEGQAADAAIAAYFARAGGWRALQSVRVVGAASLGFDMPDFASAGDRVWEVRVYARGTRSAVIWVNAETGRPRFLTP